ncbi:site-specific integrase [Maridesulfovibrio sp.]|uniref:tyrosine-type recombinase/integrase n=1 Tax=Maridesulfovibrio sp. TaxID=2795000 RepID=UPI0029CA4DE4|nr:site-specific integrase [Maridesulfovibrio sp.]
MADLIKVKNMTGVFFYEHTSKRYRGKPDRTFYIRYKINNTRKKEKIGSLSEGYSAAYASQVRAERIRQMRSNNLPSAITGTDITLNDAWEKFRDTHLVLSKNGETVATEENRYDKHIKPRFGHILLSNIKPFDLEELKAEMLQKYAPATVTHVLGQIRRIYNKHIEWELWNGTPPTKNISMPKGDNERYRYLTLDEANQLLDALHPTLQDNGGYTGSLQTYTMTLMGLHTGMRFGEIATLRGEHVNMDEGFIRAVMTKNYKGRTLYMTTQLREALEKWPIQNGHLVFPGRKGEPMKRISRAYPRAVERIGFNKDVTDDRDKVVFHTLRHTYASWMAIEGVSLYSIADLLGHSSLDMVKRYAHLCPDSYRQAVTQFEKYINRH